ncbi:ethanolamine ammonia-lyase reactivating factor EutA [Dethiothermospora halolimnae]|uniref:ethanolamine ammonia-lyase reactivating factor EutA n=1 Tax=Dethiothermospora halolimnae TaxID=3114390 RepID=UPI003CCBF405
MKEDILSVGIDIGTSTTQLVFSEITIENTASMTSVPRIKIVDKEIIYRSDIYFTPLRSLTEIDGLKVREIIEEEYKKANVKADLVDTGAVIITGETARKENAQEVLNTLSGLAGEFVVATAGPDLEGIIAGKGANASVISKERGCVVANLDIGGGTTNIAVFKNGDVIDTSCLDIGGRLIKVDKANSKITYISEKIKKLSEKIGIDINVGDVANKEKIEKITNEMANVLSQVVGSKPKDEKLELMVTDHDLRRDYSIDYISLSGGVADCVIENDTEDIFKYQDIGIILGNSIYNSQMIKDKKLIKSLETISATVVGAGSHTTDISGSTITVSNKVLPIKNIPILKLTSEDENKSFKDISETISEKLKWFNLESGKQLVALALKGVKESSFDEIQRLSRSIISGMKEIINQDAPLIVIIEKDMAKVLGQTLNTQLKFKKDVVCIDSIKVENGDYIDIGKPLADGKVVPVVVKTLLFSY